MAAGTEPPTPPKGGTPSDPKRPSKKSQLLVAFIAGMIMLLIIVAIGAHNHNEANRKACQIDLAEMRKKTLLMEQELSKAEYLNDQMKAYLAAGIDDGSTVDYTRSLYGSSMERVKSLHAEYEELKEAYEQTCN